jgi:hypothetical protein
MSEIVWRKARRSNDQGGECVEVARLPGMVAVNWRKARQSGDHGGHCVEVATFARGVAVRDSKDPEGPKLVVSLEAFRAFAAALKK